MTAPIRPRMTRPHVICTSSCVLPVSSIPASKMQVMHPISHLFVKTTAWFICHLFNLCSSLRLSLVEVLNSYNREVAELLKNKVSAAFILSVLCLSGLSVLKGLSNIASHSLHVCSLA